MGKRILTMLPLALAMTLIGNAARADAGHDEEGFHGYLRAGAGSSSTHGPQNCYGLGGNTMKYRLGNECDAYFEGGYTKEFAKTPDGVSFVGTIWVNEYNSGSDFGDAKLGLAKAYVEAKNIDFLQGGVAWIGKRYYYRPDIHMLDLQYINLNGTGGGIDGIKAGPGKISYAIFKDNDSTTIDPKTGLASKTSAALRQNVLYEGLPVNPGGTLDIAASIITAQGKGMHDGWQLTVLHKQDKVLGGGNTFGVQYGVGPGTGIGVGNDRIGASGSTMLGSDVTRARIFNDLVVQATPEFSMEFVALAQRDKSDAGGSSNWTTLGARPVYALSEHFKLQLEVGTHRVTQPNGGEALRLTTVTFAPTISAGKGYWARPELRAFVTYGKWNDPARGALNANNNAGPAFGTATNGTSAGLQVEAWF
ncbi:MAG: carbohydrate porin [Pseudomonadota bacterium]